jgi:hypothetical protein
MSLAAYDVLFNKANWHRKDWARRDVWEPTFGPLDPACEAAFAVRGTRVPLVSQLLDRFEVFPLDLSAPRFELEEDCWPRRGPEKTTTATHPLQVVALEDLAPVTDAEG